MSFTRDEKVTIAKRLGIDRITFENHIALYPTEIDSVVEDAVRTELAAWTTASLDTDFTRIEAKDKNFGAMINPDDLRASIRRNIANLLLIKDFATGGTNWGYGTRA